MPYCTSQKQSRNVTQRGTRSSPAREMTQARLVLVPQSPPGRRLLCRQSRVAPEDRLPLAPALTLNPPERPEDPSIKHGDHSRDDDSGQRCFGDVVEERGEVRQREQDQGACGRWGAPEPWHPRCPGCPGGAGAGHRGLQSSPRQGRGALPVTSPPAGVQTPDCAFTAVLKCKATHSLRLRWGRLGSAAAPTRCPDIPPGKPPTPSDPTGEKDEQARSSQPAVGPESTQDGGEGRRGTHA